ncbi:MAG TPA: DUF2079 domain-containing protein [Candidatus Methylacidiphilales bacterium]|nr:DUF2079 domain-containing protein [Candidatus Methylacidiphilales bacterium]
MRIGIQRAGTPVRLTDDQFYLSLLALMTALVTGATLWMALLLHRNFLTVACDTAEYQNAIVNTLHGHWFRDTVIDGPNVLGMHTFLIFLLFVPVCAICPCPEVLFVVQICAVYGTVLVLYLAARDFTSRPLVAFFVAASALVSPIMAQMAFAPFHPETWIAATFFGAYHFYRQGKAIPFAVCLAVGLTSGEPAAFIYLALGIAMLLGEDGVAWGKRYGTWLVAVSVAWLVLSLFIISPAVRVAAQQNIFGYHYKQWNVTSAPGLLLTVVGHPVLALETLFDPSRWLYLLELIGPVLLFIFVSRTALIIVLLSFPIYFLMDDQEFSLYFHAYYYSFAFIAGYLGLLSFLAKRELDRPGMVIFSTLYTVNILLLFYSLNFYFQLAGGTDENFTRTLREEFARIPSDAGVYGPHRYSAYLSDRPNMVMGDLRDGTAPVDFDEMVEKKFPTTDVHAQQIDYIVADFLTDQCGWRQAYWDPAQAKARSDSIKLLLASGKWQLAWQENDVVILQRVK